MNRKNTPENDPSSIDPPKSKPSKSEWPIPELKEDVHYYMENGFMVFTEAFHLARGKCCGNACRHCPFDHENVKPR